VGINLQVLNNSFIPVDFASFSMRYWFTSDAVTGLKVTCETIQPSVLACSQVVLAIKTLATPLTNADSYIDISIKPSGTATGIGYMGKISQLTLRFQANAPGFMQSNDYSFDPTLTSYKDNKKVTAYSGGTLIWGVEPS
jgi:hypothetical protein